MLQMNTSQPVSWQAYATSPATPRFMPALQGIHHPSLGSWINPQLVGPGGRCEIHRRDRLNHGHLIGNPESALYGLVPSWASDTRCAKQNCIAPMSSVMKKPAYQSALRKAQFCWTTATYFVGSIWRDGREHIVHVKRADHEPLYLAGIWSEWQADHGPTLLSFSLFTREHDASLKSQHLRIGQGLEQCYALLEVGQLQCLLNQCSDSVFDFLLGKPIPTLEIQTTLQ
jgi:SOS response associated peptidase (SRAP)